MRWLTAMLGTVLLASGCGAARPRPATTSTAPPKRPPSGVPIGVVGPIVVQVAGAAVRRISLTQVAGDRLVLVSARAASVAEVAAAAAAHPSIHFALVGASTKGFRRPNLEGLVLRDEQAALLGGITAGSVLAEGGGTQARAAWVGPQETRLAVAFARGVHTVVPTATVLRAWSQRAPVRCKEAALGAIDRGAVVVMAHEGLCAAGAIDAAHEQDHPGLQIGDFEYPSVAASFVARDAVAGIYHGGEDLVFGAASGAIGVRSLDPRISATTAVRVRTAAQQLAGGRQSSG